MQPLSFLSSLFTESKSKSPSLPFNSSPKRRSSSSFFSRIFLFLKYYFKSIVLFLIFVSVCIFSFYHIPGWSGSKINFKEGIVLNKISKETDEEWLDHLRNTEIESCQQMTGTGGVSLKFKVKLKSGHLGIIKPMEPLRPDTRERLPIANEVDDIKHTIVGRADDHFLQGSPEVVAFAIDRALGLYVKPPSVPRLVEANLLKTCVPVPVPEKCRKSCAEAKAYQSRFIVEWWKRKFLPTGPLIRVSMQAWLADLEVGKPSASVLGQLTGEYPLSDTVLSGDQTTVEYNTFKDVSNTIILEYLMSDLDHRRAGGNWFWQGSGRVRAVLLDSGLSWSFGPFTSSKEREVLQESILCGYFHPDLPPQECKPICRFHKESVAALSSLGPSLGATVFLGLKEATFILPAYRVRPVTPSNKGKVYYFTTFDFAEGVTQKVDAFFKHLHEYCEPRVEPTLF